MNASIDITPAQRKSILALLRQHLPGTIVWAYGSRVKWTSRPSSDLDLVAFSKPSQSDQVAALKDAFEESDLPFRVDLFVWDKVPEKFKISIEKEHVVLQEAGRSENGSGLPSGWNLAVLENCMEAIIDYRGKTPEKKTYGIPLVTAKIVKNGRIEDPGEFIAEADYDDWMRRGLPKPGDIVMTTEAPLGEIAQLDDRKIALAQRLITLRGKADLLDNTYLKFLMQSEFVQEQLKARASGTTVLGIKQSELRKINLVLPPFGIQRAIANILGALDDKIELNRRMNETLETMAQAMFREFFPYSTDDDLPKGWRVSTIGETVRVVGGSTPSTTNPEFWDGGTNSWVTPKDLAPLTSPVLLDSERRITDAGVQQVSSGMLPVGTVLLSSRAPIGYLAITEIPVAVNQGFIAMVCNQALPNNYIHLWTKQNMEAIKGRANGTTFMEISKSSFRPLPVVVPPKSVLDAFEQTVEPLHKRVVTNLRESRTLAALRDALLPKLLSGEIELKTLSLP